ncbi:MAG: acyltransferase [Vicinamibacteria bacterium]|nr:acyltransferase [Vicinamibacteria bacterium]
MNHVHSAHRLPMFLQAPPGSRSREDGIDAFRALGALGVIQLHFGPFRGSEYDGTALGMLSLLASFLARMAVPFFFATSGYLLARRGEPGTLASAARAQSRRILFLFSAWSLIALCFRGALRALHRGSGAEFLEPFARLGSDFLARPVDVLLCGPEEHLWFLPALVMGLLLYVAFDHRPSWRAWRPAAAAAIALIGLAAGSYGLIDLPITLNPRSGPLLAFPLVTIGAWCATGARIRMRLAWAGLASALALTAFEGLWFSERRGASPVSHDALVGFFLAGPFILTLARSARGVIVHRLAIVGRLTLGVYACHTLVAVLVLDGVRRLGPRPPHQAGLEFASFGLIACISLALAWVLSRVPGIRRLVQ